MSDKTQALINEIAIKHGVSIGIDDPILILQTLNAKLMEDNANILQQMLDQYKEELEAIALRWGIEAKEKSERILNASLTTSKEITANLLQENAKITTAMIKKEVDESLSQIYQVLGQTKQVALFNFAASVIAAVIVVAGICFR